MTQIKSILTIGFLLFGLALFAQDKCIQGDCQNGKGIFQWADGDRLEGTFLKGKMEGEGTYYWKDGSKHTGTWSAGRQHGKGIYTAVSGRVKTGIWEYGTFVKRTETQNQTEQSKSKTPGVEKKIAGMQTGCVKGDCREGIGIFVWEGQGRYEGQFKDSKRNGFGVFHWPDKSKYAGDWKDGQRHGKGVYQFPDLTTKGGIWENGIIKEEVKNMQMPTDAVVGEETRKEEAKTATTVGKPKEYSKTRAMADVLGPELVITDPEPTDDLSILSNQKRMTIKGYAADPGTVLGLWVNDRKAKLDKKGENHTGFEVEVIMEDTDNKIVIEAIDSEFNKSKEIYDLVRNTSPKKRQTGIKSTMKRTALVIGNDEYETAPLENSKNDADSVANVLKTLGFEVFHYSNLDHKTMENAINGYGKELEKKGGVGLFYFAGHGVQVNGENYLIPVKSDIQNEKDIKYKAVNLGYVLDEFERPKNEMNIIILDACRNNPFSRYRSVSNGLAPTAVAPVGTFIAYSTSPGSIASDGDGSNGLYTQELIKEVRKQGLTIEKIFKKVRSNVRKLSAGAQIPWENSSIEGEFYFAN